MIDPGPDTPEHVEALKRALAGRRVTHILVTHTHSDHSPAAAPLRHGRVRRPTASVRMAPASLPSGAPKARPGGAEEGVRVEEGGDMAFVPDVRVRDGEIVAGNGFTFECVHTPGHTSNTCASDFAKRRRCSPATT